MTTEEKTRIFGMYIGQKITYGYVLAELIGVEPNFVIIQDPHISENKLHWLTENCQLILKPISEMSEEDINHTYLLGGGDPNDPIELKRNSMNRLFRNKQGLFWGLSMKIAEYLREHGYALDDKWFGDIAIKESEL